MKAEIEKAVAALVGLPLWSSGRAADMQWFAIGECRTVITSRGPLTERFGRTKVVGEFSLHVQCPWRIVRDDTVVVGMRDLYFPADETAEAPDDFDWDGVITRRDRRIAALFENETRSFAVQRVDVGDAGALRIILERGHALEVFPHDSLNEENWRLFRPYLDEPHLVVTGTGLIRA